METPRTGTEESKPRCVVGLDIGTSSVKCVLSSIDASGTPQVIATSTRPNRGMRKGAIVDLTAVARTIDTVLNDIEGLTGYNVSEASVNANGSQVASLITTGMIATGPSSHTVDNDDLERVKEVALLGKIPPNKQILAVHPLEYTLDGQSGIRDPRGMVGSRLEVKLNAIFAMTQNLDAVSRVMEMVNVTILGILPSSVASARAVLGERQIENGVVLIDFGAATIGLSIFEEGELRFTSVIPIGSNNITNDLAMGLKTTPDVADVLKCEKLGSDAYLSEENGDISINTGNRVQNFSRADVNEIVDARLEEVFAAIREELRKAGYDKKLPEGAVLVGGGAKLGFLKDYAEDKLEMAVKIGNLRDISSVDDIVAKIELSAATGLMLESLKKDLTSSEGTNKNNEKSSAKQSLFSRIFARFK